MISVKNVAKVAVVLAVVLGSCNSGALTALAGIAPSPFSLPTSQGFDNPMFWVMFNPQPEPPGSWMLMDASDPYAPVFTIPNLQNGSFALAFDIQTATTPLTYQAAASGNEIVFSILRQRSLTPSELAYTARFTFASGSQGLNLGSGVMFNPQPEPPIFPYHATFSLLDPLGGPLSHGDVSITLRLTDAQGEPVAMQSVPEPISLVSGAMGLACVGAYLRRRTRTR